MIERKVKKELPEQILKYKNQIRNISADITTAQKNIFASSECQCITIKGENFVHDSTATKELIRIARNMDKNTIIEIGEYRGFKLTLSYNLFQEDYQMTLTGASRMDVRLGSVGALKKLDNEIARLLEKKNNLENQLQQAEADLESGSKKMHDPFAHEEELKQKTVRLEEIAKILDQINRGEEGMDRSARYNSSYNNDKSCEEAEVEEYDREEFLTEEDFERDQRHIINESGYETGKNYPVVNRRNDEWIR